jgi:hypothetical protein
MLYQRAANISDAQDMLDLTAHNAPVAAARTNNDQTEKHIHVQIDQRDLWDQMDTAIRLVFYNTVPQTTVKGFQHLKNCMEISEHILRTSKDQGLTEERTISNDFFKLRVSNCASIKSFTGKFQAGLSRVTDADLDIPSKGQIYQFIAAIEDTYPDYAKERRHDLRENRNVTVTKTTHKINDEARRDDPVKKAAFTTKVAHNTSSNANGGNKKQSGGEQGGRRGRGDNANNKDKEDNPFFA